MAVASVNEAGNPSEPIKITARMSGYFLSDLTFKHRVELTLLGDEFFGRTLLYQLAVFHHKYYVGLLDGGQAVADGDNRFILFVK